MNTGFQFEVIYKDNNLIELRASAWNGAFGGKADVYLGIGQLEEIAAKLMGFPGHPSDTREIMLGAFGPESAGGGVSMRFYCVDLSGHPCVGSIIESGKLSCGQTESVTLSLPIEAAAMDLFVEELRRMAVERAGTAHLEGALATVRP